MQNWSCPAGSSQHHTKKTYIKKSEKSINHSDRGVGAPTKWQEDKKQSGVLSPSQAFVVKSKRRPVYSQSKQPTMHVDKFTLLALLLCHSASAFSLIVSKYTTTTAWTRRLQLSSSNADTDYDEWYADFDPATIESERSSAFNSRPPPPSSRHL